MPSANERLSDPQYRCTHCEMPVGNDRLLVGEFVYCNKEDCRTAGHLKSRELKQQARRAHRGKGTCTFEVKLGSFCDQQVACGDVCEAHADKYCVVCGAAAVTFCYVQNPWADYSCSSPLCAEHDCPGEAHGIMEIM